MDGDADAAVEALMGTGRVSGVEVHGNELTASVGNGAAVISAVALALAQPAALRCRSSPCARQRSTTCSCRSPASGCRTRPPTSSGQQEDGEAQE